MEEVVDVVVLGRACRNAASIKTRQPLAKVYLKGEKPLPSFCCDIIAKELNVREIVLSDDVSAFTSYSFKPQLKTVGPKYGKYLGEIRPLLAALDGQAAMRELESQGHISLSMKDGSVAELSKDDLLISISRIPGFISDTDQGITVVLDTNLTDDLIQEGFVREIVSKIQTMRKDSGFEVTDHIRIGIKGNAKLEAILKADEKNVCADVLGEEIRYGETLQFAQTWNINGESAELSVEKI